MMVLQLKKKIAAAILSFPKPKSCYFKTENKQKKDIEKLLKIELNIHQQIPSLASLVDEFSWLMFDMIGIKDQRIDDWLTLPPQYSHTQSTYKLFLNFVKSIVSVNDHAERAIGMMQQFVHRYRDEEEKQNRLIAVDKVRSIFKASGSESLLTKKQSNKVISNKRDYLAYAPKFRR